MNLFHIWTLIKIVYFKEFKNVYYCQHKIKKLMQNKFLLRLNAIDIL